MFLLRGIVSSLGEESEKISAEIMREWQQRKRGTSTYDTSGESSVTLPLGQGEWDEPLGLPICVVCHNVSLYAYTLALLNPNRIRPRFIILKMQYNLGGQDQHSRDRAKLA